MRVGIFMVVYGSMCSCKRYFRLLLCIGNICVFVHMLYVAVHTNILVVNVYLSNEILKLGCMCVRTFRYRWTNLLCTSCQRSFGDVNECVSVIALLY